MPKVRDVIKLVEDDGWYLVQIEGDHRQYRHRTKKGRVTIAGHPGKDMPLGTYFSILRQAGLRER